MHDPDALPGRFPPDPPADAPLRIARLRIQIAAEALNEALDDPTLTPARAVLALENIAHAQTELKKWITAGLDRE